MKLATLRDRVALMTLVNVIGLTSYNQNITDNIYIILNKHYSIAKNKVTCSFVLFFWKRIGGMIARLDYQPLFGKMSPQDQRPDPGDGGNRAYMIA